MSRWPVKYLESILDGWIRGFGCLDSYRHWHHVAFTLHRDETSRASWLPKSALRHEGSLVSEQAELFLIRANFYSWESRITIQEMEVIMAELAFLHDFTVPYLNREDQSIPTFRTEELYTLPASRSAKDSQDSKS